MLPVVTGEGKDTGGHISILGENEIALCEIFNLWWVRFSYRPPAFWTGSCPTP